MSTLTSKNTHIDQALTTFSQMYTNDDFIASRILNAIRVMKVSDKYFRYSKKTVYGIANSSLAETSAANEIGLQFDSEGTYSTVQHGLASYVSKRSEANADNPLSPRMDTVTMLLNSLMLDKERRVAQIVFNTNTYPSSNVTTLSGSNQWTNAAADPVTDIQAAMRQTVKKPNVLIFGPEAWDAFRAHEKVLRAISGATLTQGATPSGGLATRQQVMALFEVADLVVGESKYDTEDYEANDVSLSYVWGKHVALVYRTPGTLSPRSVTFLADFYTESMMVESAYEVKRRSDYLHVHHDEDLKVIAQDLGAMIANVVA